MKKFFAIFSLCFLTGFSSKILGQQSITPSILTGRWASSHSGGVNDFYFTEKRNLTFNSDNTGEDYFEHKTPGEYLKTTRKFKWEIINGQVYVTEISLYQEEYKDGKIKVNSVDLRSIAKKKDMKVKISKENKSLSMTFGGLWQSSGAFPLYKTS